MDKNTVDSRRGWAIKIIEMVGDGSSKGAIAFAVAGVAAALVYIGDALREEKIEIKEEG